MNKKMKPCKSCEKAVAKSAKKCPNCGQDQRNFFTKHKILTAFLVIVVLVAVSGLAGDSDEPKAVTPETSGDETAEVEKNEVAKDEAKTEFQLGELISYKNFDLLVDNKREVAGLTDTVYTVFDITVTSKKDNFQFTGSCQGETADNEVLDDTIAFVSDDLGDPVMTSFMKKLDNGQKSKGYLAFDKDFNKLEIRSNAFASDKIIVIVN